MLQQVPSPRVTKHRQDLQVDKLIKSIANMMNPFAITLKDDLFNIVPGKEVSNEILHDLLQCQNSTDRQDMATGVCQWLL